MLLLKLFLVPDFLLLLSLGGKRCRPSVANWLAGLPVVTGPINAQLFIPFLKRTHIMNDHQSLLAANSEE